MGLLNLFGKPHEVPKKEVLQRQLVYAIVRFMKYEGRTETAEILAMWSEALRATPKEGTTHDHDNV